MKILAIIPARGGSKGVPRKNIKLLAGKPLLEYTAAVALKSTLLLKVIVSTEDDEIISVAKTLNLEIPFKRPIDLATDSSSSLSVILHALEYFESKNVYFDSVCLLQVTSPFRTVEFLDEAIQKFIKSGSDSLISVQEIPHEYNPHWSFKLDEGQNLKIATGETEIISRRQDLPKAYHRDGSIYITKTKTLKEQNSLFGKKIAHIVSPKEFYVNVDTMDDWKKAEELVKHLKL